MLIDVEALRYDLIDYFGTAAQSNPIAMADLIHVESASDYEIVNIALKNGFNLNNYEVEADNERRR